MKIRIEVKIRGDHVFVSSRDVPGLFLWGNPEKVFRDIVPVIKVLYRQNRKLDIEVRETLRSRFMRWYLTKWLKAGKQKQYSLTFSHG